MNISAMCNMLGEYLVPCPVLLLYNYFGSKVLTVSVVTHVATP